ncbi:MAG: alpha/beta hydrolase [Stagnimonas sp.]|nr:alpha/beta hydrolase [Stagnimonas sp.]
MISIEDRYIVVGKQRLHVHIGGVAGTLPPVVLESGGGSLIRTWSGFEQALTPHTQVLSYERAGIGDSSGPAKDVSAAAVTQRLEALIKAAGIRTPVILAGHSLGGLYMRYFAATRPDLVAGLVLLDATPEDLPFRRIVVLRTKAAIWLLHGLARIGLMQQLAKRLKPGGKPIELTPDQAAAYGRFRHMKTLTVEIANLSNIQAEVAALPATSPIPTLALSAGEHPPQVTPDQVAAFRISHDQLAARGATPHSRHHRMEGASHMSLLTDPAQAAAAGALILEFARQITPSSKA